MVVGADESEVRERSKRHLRADGRWRAHVVVDRHLGVVQLWSEEPSWWSSQCSRLLLTPS
jgi:hypothetical protein